MSDVYTEREGLTDPPFSEVYNVVVLPVTARVDGVAQLFQLSAGRRDWLHRMVSPHWTEAEVRQAFALIDVEPLHVEELMRGNRQSFGQRSSRRRFFTTVQLKAMGLVFDVREEPAAVEEPVNESAAGTVEL